MTDVLELADVSVVRSGSYLLRQVTWSVADGDRWVLLGPNGAGKTTLLQVAAAQLHPTAGYAAILGDMLGAVDVFELRPRIGMAGSALAERLPRYMVPRYVRVTGDLPKTASGKLQKHVLRSEGITADTWDWEAEGLRLPR